MRYAFFTCQESAVVMVGSAFERLFMQVRGVIRRGGGRGVRTGGKSARSVITYGGRGVLLTIIQ